MWGIVLLIFGGLRIIVPIFIFAYPIIVTITSTILDICDGYIAYRAKLRWQQYHLYDKILDLWWYFWIFLFFANKPLFPVIAVLFIIRLVGQVVSLVKSDTKYLVWFPNIIEHFFLIYLLTYAFGDLSQWFSGRWVIIPLGLSLVIAEFHEYCLHARNIGLADILRTKCTKIYWERNEGKTEK